MILNFNWEKVTSIIRSTKNKTRNYETDSDKNMKKPTNSALAFEDKVRILCSACCLTLTDERDISSLRIDKSAR